MSYKILCSGYLVRYPVGGLTWHHLQYLVGLKRMGHDVYFFEHYGWPDSCYDVDANTMTSDPAYGIRYVSDILEKFGLGDKWCYLAENGRAYGLSREELSSICRDCDIYFNLSNINWIPELEQCRNRVLIDTDPVFNQIGAFGMDGPFSRYNTLFTYGENVHRAGCSMPTGGVHWLPTRQPVVLDLWENKPPPHEAPVTSVMNWSAYGEHEHNGRVYGQKDRQFTPFFSLPRHIKRKMELAVNAPEDILSRLHQGGWSIASPSVISKTPWRYQEYISNSAAEFSVAKHAYVTTHSGWFSDRSAAYLASGRPVVIEDTGFSNFLSCGEGLLPYRSQDQAIQAINNMLQNYSEHAKTARDIAEEYFDADKVLSDLLMQSI